MLVEIFLQTNNFPGTVTGSFNSVAVNLFEDFNHLDGVLKNKSALTFEKINGTDFPEVIVGFFVVSIGSRKIIQSSTFRTPVLAGSKETPELVVQENQLIIDPDLWI